jgi:hypothetical protein
MLLLAAGCGDDGPTSEPPSASAAAPAVAALPDADLASPPPAAPDSSLCDALGRIVDAEPEGFLGLRASRSDGPQANGSIAPAGLSDCWIEDLAGGGARYVCSGPFADAAPDALVPTYLQLAAAVEDCLDQPIWYPLSWRRDAQAALGDGGHEIVWRDAGDRQAPVITLRLVPHPERTLWFVRLAVEPAASLTRG